MMRPKGFTLVELLAVVAIIALIAALLMPAMGAAREAARMIQCKNNAKQISLGVLCYESSQRHLPPATIMTKMSWVPFVLPFIEEHAMAARYEPSAGWQHALNRPATHTEIEMLLCPSAPVRNQSMTAVSDYAVPSFVDQRLIISSEMRWSATHNHWGAMVPEQPTKLRRIEDGMSQTMLLIEVAGRPQFWTSQGLGPQHHTTGCGNHNVRNGVVLGAAWADPNNYSPLHGFGRDGLRCHGPVAVNATNNNEAFSFHPGGVHVSLADGSVQFVEENVDIRTYGALITRAGGEIRASYLR